MPARDRIGVRCRLPNRIGFAAWRLTQGAVTRSDIKLGVPVTYSGINNAAMLLEVARQRGNYLPDRSFGTHFFHDLVEASIRYLPLYPDDPQTAFREGFFGTRPACWRDYFLNLPISATLCASLMCPRRLAD